MEAVPVYLVGPPLPDGVAGIIWLFVIAVLFFGFIVLPLSIWISKLWNVKLKNPDPNERDWMDDFNRWMLGIKN